MTDIQFKQLTGQTEEHLTVLSNGVLVHKKTFPALLKLQQDAAVEGFTLTVASGFRSFDRQMSIWEAKARGERAILSSSGEVLDIALMQDEDVVKAILRWSALPGASRHHWGTDMDIYDSAAVDADYQLQLTPQECNGAGPFAEFHHWLDQRIADNQSHGFYRPYARDLNGVAPEPWHISYAPLSEQYQRDFSLKVFNQLIEDSQLSLQSSIENQAVEIYQRFVANCCAPPWNRQ